MSEDWTHVPYDQNLVCYASSMDEDIVYNQYTCDKCVRNPVLRRGKQAQKTKLVCVESTWSGSKDCPETIVV